MLDHDLSTAVVLFIGRGAAPNPGRPDAPSAYLRAVSAIGFTAVEYPGLQSNPEVTNVITGGF
jgi:hypothetical protein